MTRGHRIALVFFVTAMVALNLLLYSAVFSQEPIKIKTGSKIDVDGRIEAEEWMDSDSLTMQIQGCLNITVFYKHDNTSIFFAYVFTKNVNKALCFPELFFDPENDKSAEWSEDDLWFHVSGTDCDSKGKHSDYSNCKIVQPEWKAAPNYELTEHPATVDGIEISIPFSKLQIKPDNRYGLLLSVEYIPDRRVNFPPDAVIDNPVTWCEAVLVN